MLALVAALLVTALPAAASAAPVQRTTVHDVEIDVMCVACGVPLEIADSPQADRERAYIKQLVDQGLTKQQVEDKLVATYSDRVLATPKKQGFGLVAFIVPVLVVLALIAAAILLLPKWREARRKNDAAAKLTATPALSDADAQRLDEDLASYKL